MNEKKYKIKEVADRIGVSPSLIRYYEEKGLVSVEKDPINGYRLFTEADVFKLWLITYHRAIHMDLGEIGMLMRGSSLDETQASVAEHREKTLKIMEQAKRDLEICDFYDRYITRARREGEPPRLLEKAVFYLYPSEDLFRREKPSFPACTLGSIFAEGKETPYSAVYEEDLFMLDVSAREQYIEKLVLKDVLSIIVSVDDRSFAADALAKAKAVAASAGHEVREPFYTLYQLTLTEHDSLGYCYEVLLPLKKGS